MTSTKAGDSKTVKKLACPHFFRDFFQKEQVGTKLFTKSKIENVVYEKTGNEKWTLTFSGIDNNTIKIILKEFFDGEIKSTSVQTLSYDIKSQEIRYKDIVIKVMEASSNSIKYKVIQG